MDDPKMQQLIQLLDDADLNVEEQMRLSRALLCGALSGLDSALEPYLDQLELDPGPAEGVRMRNELRLTLYHLDRALTPPDDE